MSEQRSPLLLTPLLLLSRLPESERLMSNDKVGATFHPNTCPECAQGKPGNCIGWTLDADDNEVPCSTPHAHMDEH
jgi:hypothetical protein